MHIGYKITFNGIVQEKNKPVMFKIVTIRKKNVSTSKVLSVFLKRIATINATVRIASVFSIKSQLL
jgi:hypothetical protein